MITLLRRLSVFVLLLVISCHHAVQAQAVQSFVPAANRVDMVYDDKRDVLYITNGTEVLRYRVSANTFLPSFQLGGVLKGIDISPDRNTLLIADSQNTETQVWVNVVDLITETSRKVFFTRASSEAGTFAVALGNDGRALITSRFAGSGWTPLRRFDPRDDSVQDLGKVRQDSMVSASADGNVIAFAESNSSGGPFGRYRVADGDFLRQEWYEDGTDSFNYEIGVNRNGTQYAIPTYKGAFITDANLVNTGRVGTYAGEQPIGVAYHPQIDVVYFAWAKTTQVRAFSTNDFSLIRAYDVGNSFESPGNHAFQEGRLRISSNGQYLFCTVDNGVRIIQLLETPVTPVPSPSPIPTVSPSPSPSPEPTVSPTPEVDNTPPTVASTYPSDGGAVSLLPVLRGTVSDTQSSIHSVSLQLRRLGDGLYWNGSSWTRTAANLEATLEGTDPRRRSWVRRAGLPSGANLCEGGYRVSLIASDGAGNRGLRTISFVYDRTAPGAPVVTFPAPNNYLASLSAIRGTVYDNPQGSNIERINLYLRRGSDGRYWTGTTWTTTPTALSINTGQLWSVRSTLPSGTTLGAGRYLIQVQALDRAGNRSPVTTSLFYVDFTAPGLLISSPANGSRVTSLSSIDGTALDNDGSTVARVEVYLRRQADGRYWNGVSWTVTAVPLPQPAVISGSRWSVSRNLPSSSLVTDGTYIIIAVAYDRAGNRTTTNSTFNISRTTASAVMANSERV